VISVEFEKIPTPEKPEQPEKPPVDPDKNEGNEDTRKTDETKSVRFQDFIWLICTVVILSILVTCLAVEYRRRRIALAASKEGVTFDEGDDEDEIEEIAQDTLEDEGPTE